MVTIITSNVKYQMAKNTIDFESDVFNYSLISGTVFSNYTDVDLRGVTDYTYPFDDYELTDGDGYTKGGQELNAGVINFSDPYTYVKFDNPSWTNATITAVGGVLWKPSDYSVVIIHNFNNGANISSVNGTFLVAFDTKGILRIN